MIRGTTRTRRVAIGAATVLLAGLIALVMSGRLGHDPAASAPRLPTPTRIGVAGALFQDRDHDGRRDPGEIGVASWRVRVLSTGPLPIAETTTDERGVFEFRTLDDLTPGERTVRLHVAPVLEGPAAENAPPESALTTRFTVVVGTSKQLPVGSYRRCLDVERCPGLEPPDLVPQLTSNAEEQYPAPTVTSIDTTTQPGRTLLRFATSTANVGGLLHVVALDAEPTDDQRRIQQRVYGSNGVLVHEAGEFVYHPEHHHFHVDAFERYELLSADRNDVLRSSEKVSFCLTDILAVDPPDRRDGSLFLDLPPLDCGIHEQGVNTGHADYYGSELPDQWIDITGIDPGRYWVRFVVDPDGRLIDADRSNNTAEFPVDIG